MKTSFNSTWNAPVGQWSRTKAYTKGVPMPTAGIPAATARRTATTRLVAVEFTMTISLRPILHLAQRDHRPNDGWQRTLPVTTRSAHPVHKVHNRRGTVA